MDPYFIIKCGDLQFKSTAKVQAGQKVSWENEGLTIPTEDVDCKK